MNRAVTSGTRSSTAARPGPPGTSRRRTTRPPAATGHRDRSQSGNVIHSSLNYTFTPDGQSTRGDVVVSLSKDGGITWGKPVIVQHGIGADLDPLQLFNDKEWVTTDTNPHSPFYGRTYLTWTRFRSEFGVFKESPIFEAHSDDGGVTWSHPQEISAAAPPAPSRPAVVATNVTRTKPPWRQPRRTNGLRLVHEQPASGCLGAR